MIQENGRTEPSAIQIGIVLFCKCSRLIAPVLWIPAIGIFIDFLTQVWLLIKKTMRLTIQHDMKCVYVVAVSQVDTEIVKAQLCHFSRYPRWKICLHTTPLKQKSGGFGIE